MTSVTVEDKPMLDDIMPIEPPSPGPLGSATPAAGAAATPAGQRPGAGASGAAFVRLQREPMEETVLLAKSYFDLKEYQVGRGVLCCAAATAH